MGDGLCFPVALRALLGGEKISRSGWNAKSQYVAVQRPDAQSKMSEPYAYLFNAQGRLVPWVPSQGDLFATDWVVLHPGPTL